ncbi:MAG: DUF1592 domain-containing protein [Lentisphaeraceae bacterium]|nr:DUF1592 domain-containing protein [Lentisphaeraceae bacterium]
MRFLSIVTLITVAVFYFASLDTNSMKPVPMEEIGYRVPKVQDPVKLNPKTKPKKINTKKAKNNNLEKFDQLIKTIEVSEQNEIKPQMHTATAVMKESCADCHNAEKKKGEFDLADLGEVVTKENVNLWHDAMEQVETEEMPPKEQLSDKNRNKLTNWFKAKIDNYLNKTVAKVVPEARRLTLKEYANSVRDLLEISNLGTKSPLNEITEDAYNHGFNTISKDLIMSSFHLNAYINTARNVLNGVILNEQKPVSKTHLLKSQDLFVDDRRKLSIQTNLKKYIRILSAEQLVSFKSFTEFKHTGYYRITINAAGMDREYPYREEDIGVHKCDPITLGVQLGSLEVKKDLPDNKPQPLVIEEWVTKGSTFGLTYVTDGLRMSGNGNFKFNSSLQSKYNKKKYEKAKERTFADWQGPRIRVHDVKIEGPFYKSWPPEREHKLIGQNPRSTNIPKILSNFAVKAYRRSLKPNELNDISNYSRSLVSSIGVKEAIKEGFVAIISSASFLYINQSENLTNYDLASKMSYTLWSTKPDKELLNLANSNSLQNGKVLTKQIKRMIASSKNNNFVENFANAWFELNILGFMPPEPTQYFYWNRKSLVHDMKGEVLTFLKEGLKNNIPITEFVSADYSYINQDLSVIYGIDGIEGEKMRKYTYKDGRRGGLLGMGAFLVSTADGVSTNPIHRGVWVKRNILGSEPAPPPADVKIEEPDVRKAKTIREVLALHNTNANCRSCHAKIDPWGWAFENFDPAGQWRDGYMEYQRDKSGKANRKQKVVKVADIDASSEMNNGLKYNDIVSFRDVIHQKEEEIVRCFIEKFITYMNGAKPDLHMTPELDKLVKKSRASSYRIVDTIIHIFQSPVTYQNRQVVAK